MEPNSQANTRRWLRYQTRSRLVRNPFAFIPLLNVSLLVFFFIVYNSSFVLKPGINISLPAGAFQQGAPYTSMSVVLTQEGLVFYNDELTGLHTLGNTLAAAAVRNKTMQLTIEADARVPYDTVIRVLNMASAAGISNIYLSVRPTFGEELMP